MGEAWFDGGVDSAVQHRVLEALEGAKNYNAWLADLTRPYLGDDPLEIGSGLGGNASLWLEAGVQRVTVSEIDDDVLQRLHARFDDDARVSVKRINLSEASEGSYSAVVGLNVLEHIEDDVEALRAAARLLAGGGRVVVFVPAFEFAMGKFDRAIGHYRRYTRRSLSDAFVEAGLHPETVRYVNAIGLPAWFVSVRLLGHEPREGLMLRAWDRGVIPVVRRIERRVSPPFGQSVLGVARRLPA
jgi:SAM-dependent methyltransferase